VLRNIAKIGISAALGMETKKKHRRRNNKRNRTFLVGVAGKQILEPNQNETKGITGERRRIAWMGATSFFDMIEFLWMIELLLCIRFSRGLFQKISTLLLFMTYYS
jgi:hypothetical protein